MNNWSSWRTSLNLGISSLEWLYMTCEDPLPPLIWAHNWFWKVSKGRWFKRRFELLMIRLVISQKIISIRCKRIYWHSRWPTMTGVNRMFLILSVQRLVLRMSNRWYLIELQYLKWYTRGQLKAVVFRWWTSLCC